MLRIDERLNLSASAAPRLDASNLRGDADAPAAQTAIQSGHAQAATAPVEAADGVQIMDATPAHTTLALPGIGLGYASLDALQDQDVAFIMTAQGLTLVTSGAQGYLVKSDIPMDSALAKIMGFDAAAGAFADFSHVLGAMDATADTTGFDRNHKTGWDIKGGTAADTVTGAGHSDILHGLAGNDVLDGGGGDDIVWGGAGLDTLRGGDGSDQLMGAAGNDSLDGGLGSDFLFAGSGADTLQGGDGADLMLGAVGADSMVGGAGDDVLVGGGDADNLTGGDGADIFLFAQGDSSVGDTGEDKVTDFVVGEDKLDLTSFTQALHIVSEFGHHAYELVMTDRDDGTLLQIDLNGDGVSDQEILVTTSDHSHLTAGDLVV